MALKELRESRLLTQAEVAKHCNVAIATVSNWERGEQRPQFSQMRCLAGLYQVSYEEIQAAVENAQKRKS